MTVQDSEILEQFLDGMRHVAGFGDMAVPVNINSKTPLGTTPLHVACIRGDADAVRVLLLVGADCNASGEAGYTPLHEAVAQGSWQVLSELLSAGANLEIRNDDGQTSLDLLKLMHGIERFPGQMGSGPN